MSLITLCWTRLLRHALVVLALLGLVALASAADPQAYSATLTVRDAADTTGTLRARSDRGTTVTFAIVTQPNQGSVTLLNGGTTGRFTYSTNGTIPTANDAFTFRVTDSRGRVSRVATISLRFSNRVRLSWPQPTTLTYGSALNVPATATVGSLVVPGTYNYTPALGTVLPVGRTTATVTFRPNNTALATVSVARAIRVNRATITITSTVTKTYGTPLPALVPSYSGFVNGDTASALTGTPTLSTTATTTSVVGTYPISVSRGTLQSASYQFVFVAGTLTVTPATPGIIISNLAHTYDGLPHGVTISTTPPGLTTTVTYDGSNMVPTTAGSYTVNVTASGANHLGSQSATLVIAQAPQSITFAPLAAMTVGGTQTLAATSSAGLPVGFTVSGPATLAGNVLTATGAGTITVTATQEGDANHLAAPAQVQTLIIEEPGGLLASYFNNTDLSGSPVLSRRDAVIDFDWASGTPGGGVAADRFSVRWEGQIVPRYDERYTLTFRTDDGVRVWVDGVLVVDFWQLRSVGDSNWSFDAEAGRSYAIRVEYYENQGLAVAKILWRSASEPFAPIPSSQLRPVVTPPAPPLVGTGSGLSAAYFANGSLSGMPTLTRQDATVAFDWQGGAAASELPVDFFSVRWGGFIQPRYSEPYTLVLRTDDGVRMWLDGELVIDDWFDRSASNSYHTFAAEAGRAYAIRIEYFERQGNASVQLSWFSASEYMGVVPAAQLYPTPIPSLTIANPFHPAAQREMLSLSGILEGGTGNGIFAWSQVGGPSAIIFGTPDQSSTTARFPETGSYGIQLRAFDGLHVVEATTMVEVVPSDVSTGLVAHYTFDESEGQIAFDSSGRQHHGHILAASRVQGKSGGGLYFDGTGTVTAFANDDLDSSDNTLTLAVWLKPDTTLQQMAHPWPMPIYRAQYETSTGYALMTTVAETDVFGLRLHHQDGFAQRVEAHTGTPLTPGTWIHAAGVFDGATATLYLNGIAVRSVDVGPITVRAAADVPLLLGMGFEGVMDDVRIYHHALSRTDIHGLAQGGTPRRTPTVDAGDDVLLTLVSPTTVFAGSASDTEGSGVPLQANWKQIAGPAAAVFSNVHSFTPSVSFPISGSYHFLLEVTDGVATGYDEVRVEVTDGSVDLLTGLILHHRCDEGSGDLVSDASGAGHHGTWAGGSLWSNEGQTMGAIRFDGLNGVVTQSSPLIDSLSAMTLSVWMNLDRPLLEMAHPWPMAMYHADYASNRGFALMTTLADSGQFGLRLHTGNGRREVTTQNMPSGRWVHVTATYDGQAMRLYVDGTQVGLNVTGALPLPAFESPVYIGNGFEGLFDEIRIYNRALSPTEVQALHTLPPLGGNG